MYLEFFQLKEKPFNVTPDPAFLYMSPSHQEAFANLLYGIREKKGFVVLTGEVGTGKTTLLHNLLGTLGDEVLTVYIFHTGLDFEEMLTIVHQELGIPMPEEKSRAGLIQSLNHFLIEQLRRDRNVAIIIDEAQNLSTEFLENLRLLSNLETSKEKLLQIVLVGQPELEGKMALPEIRQLNSRIAVRGRIQHLTSQESEAYLLHRLNTAGAGLTPLFDAEALSLLCRHGGGIPRQLNMLADNAMLIAFAEGERLVKGSHVRECVRDMARRQESEQPASAKDRSRRRSGSWLPWILFSILAVAALIYIAYQFGTRNIVFPGKVSFQPSLEVVANREAPAPEVEIADVETQLVSQDPLPLDSLAVEAINPVETTPDSVMVLSEPEPEADFTQPVFTQSREELRIAIENSRLIAYRITPGDQFNRLAERISGRRDPLFLSELRILNSHIVNFDHILPGWILYFPDFEETP